MIYYVFCIVRHVSIYYPRIQYTETSFGTGVLAVLSTYINVGSDKILGPNPLFSTVLEYTVLIIFCGFRMQQSPGAVPALVEAFLLFIQVNTVTLLVVSL